MTSDDLDFIERPIRELMEKLEEKRTEGTDSEGVARLGRELEARRREVYAHLTPWQTTLVARHPRRPYTLDVISAVTSDWMEIAGDRGFGNDRAIVAGFALLRDREVMIVGHQKGRDTTEKILRNFGMPRPEGYRKALRAMKLAERFGRPVLTFIDTPGAYPGIEAEERGQAEAIAVNLREMSRLSVPIVATVTGEGGSGGALALGVADHVMMLEHAIYSVISPEGCAAILWKDGARARDAAEALRLTAPELLRLGIVDEIVPEPPGGAHWDVPAVMAELEPRLVAALDRLSAMDPLERCRKRYAKFRAMGAIA